MNEKENKDEQFMLKKDTNNRNEFLTSDYPIKSSMLGMSWTTTTDMKYSTDEFQAITR